VYIAAFGHTWGPNKERGVYRSNNGGKTWQQVLFRSSKAGAIDLSMDANNPRVLYVAFWEGQRYPHRMNSGGADSSLYKSSDGGDTWTEITRNKGLPKGVLGKMGIVASPAQRDRVFAIVEAEDGAFFRSDDGGATWLRLSEQPGLRGRPWYYMHVYADPKDPDVAYVEDYSHWKTIDGGATFFEIPTPHGDNHDLWIDPHDPLRQIQGNDGGANVTFNGGLSWSSIYNQPTAQFYHVTTDNRQPYTVYGSQQDNTAMSVPSQSALGAIVQSEWLRPGGGESGYIAIKPDDPNIVVAGAIGSGNGMGRLIHYNHHTRQERIISVWPEPYGMGVGAIEHKYRFQWTFPIFWSRWKKDELWVAGNHAFRSMNEGHSWEVVSPDLTRNDPDKLQPSGGPISKDNTGAECYCTIFALEESKLEENVLWAGSDDGLIHISHDRGKTWQNVTPPKRLLPAWALISIIEPSAHDQATAYVAATRYKHDDLKPYLLKTSNYGKTWALITDGIPAWEFTRVLREDPVQRGLLYAGTETGIYVSFDDGAHWQLINPADGSGANLPVTPIHDFILKDDDLVVATHGRSFWILDDVTPLQQMAHSQWRIANGESQRTSKRQSAKSRKKKETMPDAHLFKPRTTVRWKQYKMAQQKPTPAVSYRRAGGLVYSYKLMDTPTGDKKERLLDAGENPPEGVIVHYYLNATPKDDVTLTFLDADGNLIRSFSSKEPEKGAPPTRLTKDAGMNRFVWNLRYSDATKLPDNTAGRGAEIPVAGPQVPPGVYQVRLTVGKHEQTQAFIVVKDPRAMASDDELREQFAWYMQTHKKLSATHDALIQLRDVRMQVDGLASRIDTSSVKDAAQKLNQTLTAIENELVQVKADDPRSFPSKLNLRLAGLLGFIEWSDTAPTMQIRELFMDLSGRIDAQLDKLNQCLAEDVNTFNELCNQEAVMAVKVKK
jgi:photosystem II stability/assembly factor-like uncharacterized protein